MDEFWLLKSIKDGIMRLIYSTNLMAKNEKIANSIRIIKLAYLFTDLHFCYEDIPSYKMTAINFENWTAYHEQGSTRTMHVI